MTVFRVLPLRGERRCTVIRLSPSLPCQNWGHVQSDCTTIPSAAARGRLHKAGGLSRRELTPVLQPTGQCRETA